MAYLTMRFGRPHVSLALLCAFLAAVGCARTRLVGASGSDPSEPEAGASSSAKPKHNTVIGGNANELLGHNNPILGDIDGDGLADFLVAAYHPEIFRDGQLIVHYLFYGRSEFPERLSTIDAEAAIVASADTVWPLGDINGDSLADFAIPKGGGDIEFVLGDRKRRSGKYALNGEGPVWRGPRLPPPFAADFSTLNYAKSAGDLDCDGVDDVLVSAMRQLEPGEAETGATFGLVHATYVVPGSKLVPSGEWDPRWAVARFEPEFEMETLIAARDLDADGCDDLIGSAVETVYVFYGGPHVFEGNISTSRADAALQLAASSGYAPLGDLDGDGFGDLIFQSVDTSQAYVVYGPEQRWSGAVQLTAELTLDIRAPWFAPVSVEAGDIDGDALAELVIGWSSTVTGNELGASLNTPGAVYAVRSSGTRLRGVYSLSTRDKLAIGPAQPPAPSPGAVGAGLGEPFSLAGDVDGDGGNDIIAGAPESGATGAVYFIPSTPRAPD